MGMGRGEEKKKEAIEIWKTKNKMPEFQQSSKTLVFLENESRACMPISLMVCLQELDVQQQL